MIIKVHSDSSYFQHKAQEVEQQDTSTVSTTPQYNKMSHVEEKHIRNAAQLNQ